MGPDKWGKVRVSARTSDEQKPCKFHMNSGQATISEPLRQGIFISAICAAPHDHGFTIPGHPPSFQPMYQEIT
jgi:hypothetical protein